MTNPTLKLDHQLCFLLYACSKEIIRQYKPLLGPLGITYTQYLVLLVLWEQDGITINKLGKQLFLDSGTLTPLLKKLETQNVITRVRGKKDERRVHIYLTSEGVKLKAKATSVPQQITACLSLSPEQTNEIKRVVKMLLPD